MPSEICWVQWLLVSSSRLILQRGYPTVRPASPPDDALFAINDKGIAVGAFETSDGEWHAYWYSIHTQRFGLLFRPSVFSEAAGINDEGVIVGWISSPTQPDMGFMLKNGKLTEFAPPGAGQTRAVGINDRGIVSGS